MGPKSTRLFLTTLVLLGAYCGLRAQESEVSMRAFGNVKVNGEPADNAWRAIERGAKIETGAGTAVIMLGAEQLQISSNTTLVLGDKSADVGGGSASRSGGEGRRETLRVAGVVVGRESTGGKVEVSQAAGNLYVHAITGTAYIVQNGQKTVVREGTTKALPGSAACPVPVSGGKPPQPVSGARSLRGPIIVGAGAGTGIAIIFATANNQGSLSPSDPSKP